LAGTACGTFGLWVYLCSTQGAPISTSYLKLDSAMVSSHLVVISKCPVQAICNTTHVIIQTTAYYSRIACVHEIIDNKREPDQQEISCQILKGPEAYPTHQIHGAHQACVEIQTVRRLLKIIHHQAGQQMTTSCASKPCCRQESGVGCVGIPLVRMWIPGLLVSSAVEV